MPSTLADIPGKRIRRYETPILVDGQVVWRQFEEFDTGDPIIEALPDDYFATLVTDYLEAGNGACGNVGDAPCVLVDAAEIVRFAVSWLESRYAL